MKKVQLDQNRWLISTDKYHGTVDEHWFEPERLKASNSIIGTSVGRSTTYFFERDGKKFVLRRYYRGGLLGKLRGDRYWFSGVERSRAYRELSMLRDMRGMGLPVPKPVALLLERKGFHYSASIIIRLIKHSQDLFHKLQETALTTEQWARVGRMIRKFHEQGVFHSDLNIHNILLAERSIKKKQDKFWLIDFDKCRFVEPNAPQLQNNLERLKRSLLKEQQRCATFYWQESDWECLLEGYQLRSELD